jgi:lysophospholipase L1-like esterase
LVILTVCGCVEIGADVDKDIQNLKAPDSSVRLQTAEDLAKTTESLDPKTMETLIEVLETDKNSSVVEQAANVLDNQWEAWSNKTNGLRVACGAIPLSSAIIAEEGDSLTAGLYSTDPYPTQLLVDWIYPQNDVTNYNNGISGSVMQSGHGNSISDRTAAFDAQYNASKTHNIAIIWGGTNDIGTLGRNASEIHNDIQKWCSGRKAVGWKVLVCTLTANRISSEQAYWNTTKLALNALIRTNWQTYADGIVDLGADPLLGSDASAQYNRAIWTDGLHFTAVGDRKVARLVKNAIQVLVNRTEFS